MSEMIGSTNPLTIDDNSNQICQESNWSDSNIKNFLFGSNSQNVQKQDCEKSRKMSSSNFSSQNDERRNKRKEGDRSDGSEGDENSESFDYYKYAAMRRSEKNSQSSSHQYNPYIDDSKKNFKQGGYLVSGRSKSFIFRFPMLIETNLTWRHQFYACDQKIDSNIPFTTVIERDKENRYDRNAILVAIIQTNDLGEEKKFYLGYIPKDVSFSLARVIDENRDYYTIRAQLDLRTNKLTIGINLTDNILKGQRNYEGSSGTYSIQNLPGMPKQLKTWFIALNRINKNVSTGDEYKWEDSEDSDGPNESDLPTSIADISTPDLKWLGVDEVTIRKDIMEEDSRYVRNFNLVLETIKGYDFLFSEHENEMIKRYHSLSNLAKGVYVRMYFGEKHWYSSITLFKFNKDREAVTMALGELKRAGFIRDFNDVLDMLDYERMWDAMESLTPTQLKTFESEANRILRAAPKINMGLDETLHNPFYFFKHAVEGNLKLLAASVSQKFSDSIRAIVQDWKKEKKKVLPFPNFSYSNKPDVISNIIAKIYYMEKQGAKEREKHEILDNTNLHQFFQRSDNSKTEDESFIDKRPKLRDQIKKAFFNANEGAGFSWNEVIKGFFQRWLRLFFFYSADDTYEKLMLNDYGFYTFVKRRNYLLNKEENLYYLKPIFETREQWIEFDDAVLLKLCVEQMLAMRIRRKDLIADVIEHIWKELLRYFDVNFDENTKGIVLMGKLNDIFEIWKKKINEIEEVISEHQRQQLERNKEEEDRIDQFGNSSQNDRKTESDSESDKEIQKENCELLELNPWSSRMPTNKNRLNYDDIESEKEVNEIEDLLEEKQSQEIAPNHLERDHKGRRIPQFTERFRKEYMYLQIMADFFKWLEKGKRYDVCLIVMSQLLVSEKLEDRRGYWWLRFTMNLKHLKWKQEAFDAWEIALKDPEVRTANRNRILKIRFKAFEDLHKVKKPRGKGGRKRKLAGTGGINDSQSSDTSTKTKKNKRELKEESKYRNASRPTCAGDSILGDIDDDDTKELDEMFAGIDADRKSFKKLKSKLDSVFKDEDDGTSQASDMNSQSSISSISSSIEDDDNRDPSEILIEQEKEKTLRLLIKSSDIFYDKDYYSERHIRGKRAYTGQQLRIVYMDQEGTEFLTVENLALKFYGQQGWYGLHVENTLFKTYYGLLFWEQIYFEKVDFVFQTPYQFGPLDFGYREFYQSRKSIFDERLKEIEKIKPEDLRKEIESAYDKYLNTHNVLVNWDSMKLSKERLSSISVCLGGKIIAKIIKKYLDDFKTWKIGMPDLILWKEETRESMFVEVKSETDTVAEHQKWWLSFLTQSKQKVEVWYVNDKVDGVDVF